MILIDEDELEALERVCEAAGNIETLMDEDVIGITTNEPSVKRVTDEMVEFKMAVDAYREFLSNSDRN